MIVQNGLQIYISNYPISLRPPLQFEKGWLVMNCGTKKWKHVKLVHQDGYPPLQREVAVPELKPGERVELVAEYPPVTDNALPYIQR